MLTLLMSNTQVDTVEDVQDGRAGPDRHPAPDRGAPLAAVQPRRGALLQVKIFQLTQKIFDTDNFCRRQHIDISREVVAKLRKLEPSTKLSALDRQNLSTLLLPLLKLRQACCHPQVLISSLQIFIKLIMTIKIY